MVRAVLVVRCVLPLCKDGAHSANDTPLPHPLEYCTKTPVSCVARSGMPRVEGEDPKDGAVIAVE